MPKNNKIQQIRRLWEAGGLKNFPKCLAHTQNMCNFQSLLAVFLLQLQFYISSPTFTHIVITKTHIMRFLDSVGHNSNWLHICIPQKLPKINHYAVKNSYQGLSIGTKIGNFWSVYHLATPCGRTARYVTSQLDKPQILFLLLGIHRAYCLVRKKVKIFYGFTFLRKR
jgi:hypothetical protein